MTRVGFPFALILVALMLASCGPLSLSPNKPLLSSTVTPAAVLPSRLPPGQELINDVTLENVISLAGKWRYKQVQLFSEEMAQPKYDDSQWSETDAPATWGAQGLDQLTGQPVVVVYRRRVEIPADWPGKPIGISAWFNPYSSQVFVNGQKVEPARKPFAPYADVSTLLHYGEANTVAVTTLYDGVFEMAESGHARIGLLGERAVTQVLHEDAAIKTEDKDADATLIRPAAKQKLPALILIATGSHGLPEKQTWFDFADDLARQGYVSLALALPVQKATGALAAVQYLRSQPFVDPEHIVLLGADEGAQTAVLAASQDQKIRGVILLSAQSIDEVAQLGNRPALLLASQKDRSGYFVEQAQAMAQKLGGPHEVVTLPGTGHGTSVFMDAWNATRQAVTGWMQKLE